MTNLIKIIFIIFCVSVASGCASTDFAGEFDELVSNGKEMFQSEEEKALRNFSGVVFAQSREKGAKKSLMVVALCPYHPTEDVVSGKTLFSQKREEALQCLSALKEYDGKVDKRLRKGGANHAERLAFENAFDELVKRVKTKTS